MGAWLMNRKRPGWQLMVKIAFTGLVLALIPGSGSQGPGSPGHQEFGDPPGKNDAGDIGKPAVILVGIILNAARYFLDPAQGESHNNCYEPTTLRWVKVL